MGRSERAVESREATSGGGGAVDVEEEWITKVEEVTTAVERWKKRACNAAGRRGRGARRRAALAGSRLGGCPGRGQPVLSRSAHVYVCWD